MEKEQSRESEVLYERCEEDGRIWGEIVLNRPDKGNALNMPMIQRLSETLEKIENDRSIRVVVIKGRGRFFCTGGDIAAWGTLSPHQMARDWILPGIQVIERLAALPIPVIAVLSGHALGGGLELALAADLRIAVTGAKIGTPEVTLGMISGWMGVRRLAEIIGVARARQLTLLGLPIPASQALDWGLVNAVAANTDELEQQLSAWLTTLCSNGPAAMELIKGILASMHADLSQQHASAAAEAAGTDDCKEGVLAFREKRKPLYRGR
jgi:enoyl-CoA hydratase